MDRTILHVDINNCYASIECLYNPAIRHLPVAVCGDIEMRRGIVLAKNNHAKALGIKTGEAIWQAKQKAKNLVVVPPDFKKYLRFSGLARKICADYSDQVEPYGIDESWIDATNSRRLFGGGEQIAEQIRKRMKEELGLTVSVGVSFNKIFAKLGSDMKKPDATTVLSRQSFKRLAWPLPVETLLYVGRATKRKLNGRAIFTIGDLAGRKSEDLKRMLGVWGETLHAFANGYDLSRVRGAGEEAVIKSVGNSTTTARDLQTLEDVKMVLYVLAESVASRLREQGLSCSGVAICARDNALYTFERQKKIDRPTFLSGVIADAALKLFVKNYDWQKPVRSVGVRAFALSGADRGAQLSLFEQNQVKLERLEFTVDALRKRFGHPAIGRASALQDPALTGFNPKEEHVVHPTSFFR